MAVGCAAVAAIAVGMALAAMPVGAIAVGCAPGVAGAQAASSSVATRKTAKILDFFNLLNILYSFEELVKIVQTNNIGLITGAGYPGTRYMR
jgi:hypothetical protein